MGFTTNDPFAIPEPLISNGVVAGSDGGGGTVDEDVSKRVDAFAAVVGGGGDGAEAGEREAEAALGGDEQPTACDTVSRERRDCLPKVVGVRGGGGDETSGFAGGVGGVVWIGGVPVVWAVVQVRVQSVPRGGIGDGGEHRLGTFGVTEERGEGWQS